VVANEWKHRLKLLLAVVADKEHRYHPFANGVIDAETLENSVLEEPLLV
jgi:hypothetical protein